MDKIYLSAKRDGDNWILVDQDGRQVAMVQGVTVWASKNDMTKLTVELLDSRLGENAPYASGSK